MASIVQLLLGGLLTVGGGAAATLLQGHLQSRARAEEHAERRRESRRTKAELVFEELGDLVKAYSDQWLHSSRRATYQLAKQIPGNQAQEPTDAPPAPSVAQLEGLVSIYFPRCLPIVASFNEEMRTAVSGYTQQLLEYVKAHEKTPEPAFVTMVHMTMAQDLSQRATAFSEQLRDAMRPEVEKLW